MQNRPNLAADATASQCFVYDRKARSLEQEAIHPVFMLLNYKDFFPTVLKSGFFSTTHEELPATVERASKWIEASGIHVINVETVVLPNIQAVEDASQVGIRTSGEISSRWYQVVRVWYEQS